MLTYYRDADVVVTSTGVRMAGRQFALADFTAVWHRRSRRSWGIVAGRGVIGLAVAVPVLVGLLGIGVALLIHASAGTTVALIGGGILAGLLALPLADVLLDRVDRSYDRGSRSLEIWGRVGGADVLLLRTGDRRRFGQIYRALQRALDSGPA
ncbi:DUF6232 family protein [Actinoplanes sp. NPDC049265]|uniref:DUF6232 family protein n=1 Tax=Actinoplanes sp. NPDC049265 TaxID=3363902 RepID=UPI00371CC2D3